MLFWQVCINAELLRSITQAIFGDTASTNSIIKIALCLHSNLGKEWKAKEVKSLPTLQKYLGGLLVIASISMD